MKYVGQISYTNTKPFFYNWNKEFFDLIAGTPRELSEMVKRDRVVAAALPIVECWKLEKDFEPLENWGIAVQTASNSVFLLSNEPISELKYGTIGVTTESHTSVALCQVLIQQKYKNKVNFRRGFSESDIAWLVIGDQALQYWGQSRYGQWSYVTDLATDWWKWQQKPFVFAQWVVKKNLDPYFKDKLITQIRSCLREGLASIPKIAAKESDHLIIPTSKVIQYLEGFTYHLGPEEKASMAFFRELVQIYENETALVFQQEGRE